MTARAYLVVRGQVQGVWFRGSMQEEAARLGVAGWVRNRPDGAVEAEVEADRAVVDAIIAWAWHGPPGARVTGVTVAWVEARGERGAFAIRH